MWQNPPANLVTFTEEILNGKVLEWRSQNSRKALTVVAKLFILDVLEALE